MEISWIVYVLLALHVIAALWATNFLDFFVAQPKNVKIKRLFAIWLLPVVGIVPVLKMRKYLIEESKKLNIKNEVRVLKGNQDGSD